MVLPCAKELNPRRRRDGRMISGRPPPPTDPTLLHGSVVPRPRHLCVAFTAQSLLKRRSHHRAPSIEATMSTFDLSAAFAAVDAADIMGAAGVALGSTWALFRSRRTILACQALGSLAFGMHYVLIGSLTAAIACMMSMAQSVAGYSGRRQVWLGPLYLATWAVVAA